MPPEGPVAWVTGAAGGIGRATTTRLRQAGFRILATDLADRIADPAADPGVDWCACDVTDETAVAATAARCTARFGRMDALVHLAGRVGGGSLTQTSLEDWRSILDANLTSAFLVARAAHPALRASGEGCLVLVSSTNGLNGGSALSGPAYAAAKAGVINLTRYLAREWCTDGIRVNCVAPGPVDTPMLARLDAATIAALVAATPAGRLASAADVAGVIHYLCSTDAAFLTGTVHNVSGGMVPD